MLLKTRKIKKRVIFSNLFFLLLTQRNAKVINATTTPTTENNLDALTLKPTSAPNSAVITTKCAPDYWPRQLDTMLSYIDETVRPCDNFHAYACGNWRAPHNLRACGARDTLTTVKADNKQLLMSYMREKQKMLNNNDTHTTRSERNAMIFFNSCLKRITNEENDSGRVHLNVESTTIKSYTDELRRISEWPLLNENWQPNADTLSWGSYISAELQRYGVQALWRLLVNTNWQQAEQQIFYITAPTFDLLKPTRNAEHYDSDSEYVYKRYVKYLMLDMGLHVRRAQSIAAEVVGFEKLLYELVPSERLVLLREPQTLESLQKEVPDLQLRAYFQAILRDNSNALPVDYEERLLIVADVPYLRKLNILLKRIKPELLGKYFIVQFLAHFKVRLNEEFGLQAQRYYCLQQLHTFLPAELTEIFLRLQQNGNAVQMTLTHVNLNDIFAKLKLQFERMLNATNVFERDALTRVLGLEKLRAMRLLLPQLSDGDDDGADVGASESESKDYLPRSIQLDDNYDTNLMKLWHWHTQQQLAAVLETLKTGRATTQAYNNYGPLDVNAYYRLKKNAIELPVGILREPFFHTCLNAAKIYGSFVYILAHELMHGFDYDGLNYDKSGNIAGNWGAKALIKFGTKSRCYLNDERYNGDNDDHKDRDGHEGGGDGGELKVNENIADTEGLRLALETYKHVMIGGSGVDESERNSTLTLSQLKLFFLSFAQTWCGVGPTASRGLHDVHDVRVNNVVSNFEEFAQAYHCDANSNMNPQDKCGIW